MTFNEILMQILEQLRREGRVSYRALKRQFALDDEYLEDLKTELIDAKRLAIDEEGKVLVIEKDFAQGIRYTPVLRERLRAPGRFYRILQLWGDSMEPMFSDGAWLLVNFLPVDSIQSLVNRPVAVWRAHEKGATVKILRLRPEAALADFWVLHAMNEAYPEQFVRKDEEHLQIAPVEAAWQRFT